MKQVQIPEILPKIAQLEHGECERRHNRVRTMNVVHVFSGKCRD